MILAIVLCALLIVVVVELAVLNWRVRQIMGQLKIIYVETTLGGHQSQRLHSPMWADAYDKEHPPNDK